MSHKKSWGETVVGWFVEREEGDEVSADPAKTHAPASAPRPSPVKLQGEVPPPPEPGGGLDFAAVYRAAGLDREAQDRVEKAITLLKTLPDGATPEVGRQIVEASLKAFGYPVEQIIAGGAAEIQALQAFIELGERNTETVVTESRARVEALKQEIADIEAGLQQKLGAQARLTDQCNKQKLRVQQVLEFFGREAVASVVDQNGETAAPGEPTDGE